MLTKKERHNVYIFKSDLSNKLNYLFFMNKADICGGFKNGMDYLSNIVELNMNAQSLLV